MARLIAFPCLALIPATLAVGSLMSAGIESEPVLKISFMAVFSIALQVMAAIDLPKYLPRRGVATYSVKRSRAKAPPRAPESATEAARAPSEAIDVAGRGLAQLGIPKARADRAIKHAVDRGCVTEATILREALRALA